MFSPEYFCPNDRRFARKISKLSATGGGGAAAPPRPPPPRLVRLWRMSMFTRAEMNMHILKSGKHIDPHSKSHSVPTSMRKAKTFLDNEYLYLNDLSVASDQVHFFFKPKCYHSFRKNYPPHNLKVALDLVSGEVKNASCTCVAGQIGFCNHILALLMKICKNVRELEEEDDMRLQRPAPQLFSYGTERVEIMQFIPNLLWNFQ